MSLSESRHSVAGTFSSIGIFYRVPLPKDVHPSYPTYLQPDQRINKGYYVIESINRAEGCRFDELSAGIRGPARMRGGCGG